MQSEPLTEHRWLEKFIGEWEYETEAEMEPGKPLEKFIGTESVRSLGGLWILAEGHGGMPDGSTATMILTLGYDPQKKLYVGTWVGSMMTHLWVYSGAVDTDGKTLTLDTEGPDMSVSGKMAKYRDVYEIKNDDYRTLTSHVLDAHGTWQVIMTTGYRRKQ
jgi:hypothetical protein